MVEGSERRGGGWFLVGILISSGAEMYVTTVMNYFALFRSPFTEVGGDLEEEFVGEGEEGCLGVDW